MYLDIGSGKKVKDGYVRCDIRDLPNVDYCCKSNNLPFKDNNVDKIYSRHLIEHFTLKEFLEVLEEWNRVLKVGGEIYIICPNLLYHLKQILDGGHESFYKKLSKQNDRYWGFGSLFGWQQDEYDIHKFGYYFELLSDILKDFGFGKIEDLTNTGLGLENESWHLEVRAIKMKKSLGYKKSKFYSHFDVEH